jgi:hypothetical protein
MGGPFDEARLLGIGNALFQALGDIGHPAL